MESNLLTGIETERLYLLPMTYEFMRKIVAGDNSAYTDYDVNIPTEWPNREILGIMPFLMENISGLPKPDGFGAWVFIEKATKHIIGDGGFKGAPDNLGTIDIGYGLITSKRRQGFAYEAVVGLLEWGFSQPDVITITADCDKDNIASNNLLLKAGMIEINQDDESIYFEKKNQIAKKIYAFFVE